MLNPWMLFPGTGKCKRCCCRCYLHSNIQEPSLSNRDAGLRAYSLRSYPIQWSKEEKQMRPRTFYIIFSRHTPFKSHARNACSSSIIVLFFIRFSSKWKGGSFCLYIDGPVLQSGEISMGRAYRSTSFQVGSISALIFGWTRTQTKFLSLSN